MHVITLRKSHLFEWVVQDKTNLTIKSDPTCRNRWNMGKTSHKPTPDLSCAQVPEQSSVVLTLGQAEKGLQKKKNNFHCLFAVADAWVILLCLRWGICIGTCTFESGKTRQGLFSFKGCSQAKLLYNSIILWCYDSFLALLLYSSSKSCHMISLSQRTDMTVSFKVLRYL